jgi:3-hydroxyisobutyrate dehydrogenase-like beta-hydroxyacid dehydrogenase
MAIDWHGDKIMMHSKPMTEERIALIGFGEAGSAFADAAAWRSRASAYDILAGRREAIRASGIVGSEDVADILADARTVLSLVTADAALEAALAALPLLGDGAVFCDMNSVAPSTKRAAAQAFADGGKDYVDVAIMAPVEPARLDVPLLVSGPAGVAASQMLGAAGFRDVRLVGEDVGRASAIKMLRSVMIKGIEALTAEMMAAADILGVTEEVIGSLDGSEKQTRWAERAAYNLERMHVHGLRRAAEMEEAAKTLIDAGVEPVMTSGTVRWQRAMARGGDRSEIAA